MPDNILTYFEQIKAQGLSIDITRESLMHISWI
jgi:hypothetical protein